eukprot:2717501-Pyramimonas_sp.AAC.2
MAGNPVALGAGNPVAPRVSRRRATARAPAEYAPAAWTTSSRAQNNAVDDPWVPPPRAGFPGGREDQWADRRGHGRAESGGESSSETPVLHKAIRKRTQSHSGKAVPTIRTVVYG